MQAGRSRRLSAARDRHRLARRVRELRTTRGLSQADLAGRDFTKGFVSQLETGRVGLSPRAANIFAQRLGVPVADLVRVPDEAERLTQLALLEAERELAQGSPAKALSLVKQIKDAGILKARVLRLEGRAKLALDQTSDAVRSLERAAELFRATQDRESEVRTLYDIAYGQARLDRPQQALVLLLQCEQALRARELVDRTLELEVESFLASTYGRMGDAASAEPHLERAQEIAKDVVSHDALAALYGRLATAEQQVGHTDRALELWQKCLLELGHLGRERQVADVWHNIAATYLRLGQKEKARSSLSRADELQKQTGHVRLGAWLKITRARLAMEERRLGEAEKLAREASTDQQATALARGEALLLTAQILSRRGAPVRKVVEAFDEALAVSANEPAGTKVRALKLYAEALERAGDIGGAYRKSREALELVRPGH